MIGQTISHYKILAELGKGGMGVVYQAEDLKLGRIVAIKILPARESQGAEAERRFAQEARAASTLDHSSVGVIHEIDQTEDGQTFIVMGFYEGGSLQERIARERPGLLEALDLTIQIAGGLAQAHAKGIVHRDIKPANILLTGDSDAKIIDFGLAKLTDQTRLTKTGATVGTLFYMSPEQVRGVGEDNRTDIFALGVVLYELVTGCRPFGGDSEAAILYAITQNDPEPLSAHLDNVPGGLQEVVDRALAKESDERYQSATDLLNDLEIVRRGLLPEESKLWRAVFRAGSVSRKVVVWRVATLSLAAVLLAMAGFLVFRQLRQVGPGEEPSLAVVDFLDLATPDDLTISAGITGLIHVGLVESCPIRLVSPDYLHDLRRRMFGAARGPIAEDQALSVAQRSGASLLLSGQTTLQDGNRYITWRLVDTRSGKSVAAKRVDGDNLAQLVDRIIAEVLPFITRESGVAAGGTVTPVSDLTTASPQAYQYFVAGILARDAYKAQDAVHNFEAAVQIDTTFAAALFELSRIYYSGTAAGVQYDLAEANAEKAWTMRKRLGVKDRLRLEAWREQLDFHVADAIDTYQELLERWPDDREILNNYHRILFYYWYSDRALEVAEEGLKIYPDDLYFGLFYQIGLAHQGRMEEALAATRRYLRKHPREPNAWDELGMRYLSLAMPDSAESAYRRALQIDPDFLPSQQGLGYCEYSRGKPDEAIAITEEILAREGLMPGQRVDILTANAFWPGLAFYHAEAGRYGKALALFEEARQLVTDPVSEVRLETGRARFWLRMGRSGDVLRWARSLKSFPAGRLAPLVAIQYQARAQVALDSLAAARAAVAKLHDTESSWGGVARSEALKVSADIALAEHDPTTALDLLAEAARHGIPDGGFFDQNMRETRARAHRMAGRYMQAERILQDMLLIYGSHALTHYQLGQIYEEMGRDDDARNEYEAFLTAWTQADAGRPELTDARRRLAALKESPSHR